MIGGFEFIPVEVGVIGGGDMAKEIITERFGAVLVEDFDGVDDVADGFAHFGTVDGDVAMDKHGFGQGQVETE